MTDAGGGGGGVGGPCGACKFLRRKCVRSCIFAPYFDAEQGAAHFAAVHRVFGASNASKLLLRLPAHRRLDAAVTLCYEALARVRDPVYGCVAHIFTLQQQVVNLQAELAIVQARISTLQRGPPVPAPSDNLRTGASELAAVLFDQSGTTSSPKAGMVSFCGSVDPELAEDDGVVGLDLPNQLARDSGPGYFT